MWSEALSALAQATYRREMPVSALGTAVERLEGLPVTTLSADSQHRRAALGIALELGWAKTYDAEYVALARSLGCSLLTMDKRLQRGAERMIDIVVPLDVG
jgi:predicted nucleic acid-binding protein